MLAAHVNGSTRGQSFDGGRARRSVERAVRRYQPGIFTLQFGPDTSPEFQPIKEEHNERSIL